MSIDQTAAFAPPPDRARPWRDCPPERLRRVHGVFTDIDDTLTADGAIEPAALVALQALADAGLRVVAVTGRPMGWSLPFARDWPVAAIVAENGSVALRRDGLADSGVRIDYAQDEPTRRHNAQRLQAAAQRILAELPHARLALDSPGRVTDLAVDHAEHARLEAADVARVVALMREAGMTATVSSIHVNGWFGDHSKWTGARWALQLLHGPGRELADEVDRWIYVGDSTNDQPMFERFGLSVGVANLMDFAAQLERWPAYLASQPRGRGFAEVAQSLLRARTGA